MKDSSEGVLAPVVTEYLEVPGSKGGRPASTKQVLNPVRFTLHWGNGQARKVWDLGMWNRDI